MAKNLSPSPRPIQISVAGFYKDGKFYRAMRINGKFYFYTDDPELLKYVARKYGIKK